MNKRSFTKTLARAALLLTTSGVMLTTVWAQQGALVSTPTPKPASAQAAPNASPTPSDQTTAKGTANGDAGNATKTTSSSSDNRYRIGPGDVLDIRVIRAPELSREAVRVDQSGMIRIPMIDEDVRAACLTEGELSKEIARRYKVYKNDPKVDVFVKEYQSQPVALIGAVNEPGQFKLQRKVTLLELLTYVKGPTEKAGRSINVIHAGTRSICEDERPGANPGEELQTGLVAYRLQEVMKGDTNPVIQPGDIITVPEADQIYVVGNVVKPLTIPLREPITVSRAIAMAGGVLRDTKSDKIRIVRQEPGSTTKQEIYVDLKAIEKKKSEDIALQANDIVDVPESGAKSFLRTMLGTIAPAISQLPVRVIP